jgi:hypothetical protein
MRPAPEMRYTGCHMRVLYSALSAPLNNYYMQRKLHELQQWKEEIITVGREGISALARCIRQFVQTVEKNVRFPSSPPRGDLFTVTSAFRNTGSPGSKSKKPIFTLFTGLPDLKPVIGNDFSYLILFLQLTRRPVISRLSVARIFMRAPFLRINPSESP